MSTASINRVSLSVAVPQESRDYQVIVGPGVLASLSGRIRELFPNVARVALISDSNVMPLHGRRVGKELRASGLSVSEMEVPAGEESKSWSVASGLISGLLSENLSRADVVIAVGGGVVGDLAGFVSSLFMRGIPVIQCPTSLLAQVDASVGGKVAIDIPEGKNLIGAFHFPSEVLIDTDVLQTLPDVEIACGMAEMIKHAALFSPESFSEIVRSSDQIFARHSDVLTRLVSKSVGHKAVCVSADPRERASGATGRIALNLGHTFGHAVEAISKFSLKHGQAVGIGLRAAARLSERAGLAEEGLESRFVEALGALRLESNLDDWLEDKHLPGIISALRNDKKRGSDSVTYIGLNRLGSPVTIELTPEKIVGLLRS